MEGDGPIFEVQFTGSAWLASDDGLLGARDLADRALTLPVYPGLGEDELERIVSAVERSAREVRKSSIPWSL